MKRILSLFMGLFIFFTGSAAQAEAIPVSPAQSDARDVLALTYFNNPAYSILELMYIDTLGGVYQLDMTANGYDLCSGEMCPLILTLPEEFRIGTLSDEELARINQLAEVAAHTEPIRYETNVSDAGIFKQFAFYPNEKGEMSSITLMFAGDDISENMDPSAMELSAILAEKFDPSTYVAAELIPYGKRVPTQIAFTLSGATGGRTQYSLTRIADKAQLTIDSGNTETRVEAEVSAAEMKALGDLIAKYSLTDWNGFNGGDPAAQGSEAFELKISTGADQILAQGSAVFPENFAEARAALEEYFKSLSTK